jgi:hypothetical protein
MIKKLKPRQSGDTVHLALIGLIPFFYFDVGLGGFKNVVRFGMARRLTAGAQPRPEAEANPTL